MADMLVNDETVSVSNFGTLSPYRFHAHRAFDVTTGSVAYLQGFRTVKFHSHSVFASLLKTRRVRFEKKPNSSGKLASNQRKNNRRY